jgi:DNA (cytosine-5)-methyltransferase 1
MNHQEKLKNIYNSSFSITDISGIPEIYRQYIKQIGSQAYKNKGVYTVLITLLTHKCLYPKQDIRKHQSSMEGGFSGRSIDTEYITPTLKYLELPAMAETGWLTRSLEQPYPYTLDYGGKIRSVKEAFLNLIDYVQTYPNRSEDILRLLLNKVIEVKQQNKVIIQPLKNPDYLTIDKIILCLQEHFFTDYKTHGGSKLPVLALYAMYKILIQEVKRYQTCSLLPLGSHTASDLTSKSSGDIEILDSQQNIFESIEVKHNQEISLRILNNSYEKIKKFNPVRYYIFSSKSQNKEKLSEDLQAFIQKIKKEHGCQVIINGILPTIKYNLRLISLEKFINEYSNLVSQDTELQKNHKQKWNELIEKISVE